MSARSKVRSLFFIAGPTAVGKTEIAIEVATRINAEIINCDAFQIYRGLNILTAKPSREDREKVAHHLVDAIPLSQAFDAAQFAMAARTCADEIASRRKVPLVVGGTGFYIRALTHGLPRLPPADDPLRARLDKLSLDELTARLAELDQAAVEKIDVKNKRRLVRAIEVCELTGQPFSAFAKRPPAVSGRGVLLVRDRDDLYARIDRRVEKMFARGVVDEVRAAGEVGRTASQIIGLESIRRFLKSEISEGDCIEEIQRATRHYAKRQLTWFRREPIFETLNLSTYATLDSAVSFVARRAMREFADV